MRVHVVSTSFEALDKYWEDKANMQQDSQMARAGDRVRLKKDLRTVSVRGRPARTVPAGATGLVLTSSGSLLRVQFSDADVIDEAVVSAYDVALVTEPDDAG